MMHCTIGSASVLYTGDYNMVSDRLLGAAKVPRLRPDVLITESTYATTLRDPRRAREGRLLDAIHGIVKNGGKVLVPVFAVGSAQELSLLIDSFWQRMHLKVCSHLPTQLPCCALLPCILHVPHTVCFLVAHATLRTAMNRLKCRKSLRIDLPC